MRNPGLSSPLAEPPERLNLLFLYDCVYPESVGGIERRNLEVGRALAARGHRVTLAGWTSEAGELPSGVRRLSIGPAQPLYDGEGRRRLAAAWSFARQSRRIDLSAYDLVETANVPFLHLLPIAWRCLRARRPLVISWYEVWGTYWRRYVGRYRWPFFALFESLAAQLGSVATASSHLTLERLTKRRLRRPVILVPCGIDLDHCDEALTRSRQNPRNPTRAPLLYAGRLLPEKRLDLLLRAVSLLPARGAATPRLRVVGDGPDRERLESLTIELGIADRVELVGRLPSSDDVWAELAQAQIAVQPSAREGFGLFPLEAMAAGLPVVYCASPESAVGELVRHEREGLMADAEPAALAAAIGRLLDRPDERARFGQAARARAESYDWGEIARNLEEELARLVRPHPRLRRGRG